MGDNQDDAWADSQSNDNHHEGWSPSDDAPGTVLPWCGDPFDEQGNALPF